MGIKSKALESDHWDSILGTLRKSVSLSADFPHLQNGMTVTVLTAGGRCANWM